jgi:hypothetical protein
MQFTHTKTMKNYTIRPHFLFDIGKGSQNFQIDNSTDSI